MTTEQKLRSYSIGSGHPDAARIIQLERENAALEKRLQEIRRMCLGYQAEHTGLRKDAERYRWWRMGKRLVVKCKSAVISYGSNPERDYAEKFDAAIDAAMKEQT